MNNLNLQPSHTSGGHSTNSTNPLGFNPLGFSSLNANINGASSPRLSDYGSIAPKAMQSRSSSSLSLMSNSLGLRRPRHQIDQSAGSGWRAGSTSRSSRSSKESTSLSTGSSSQWLRQSPLTSDPTSLEQEISDLCQLNSNLEEKYKILEVQHKTLRDAYDSLLNALRQGGALKDQGDNLTQTAKREDYPDVRFWTRRDWIDRPSQENDAMVLDSGLRRGKTRASQGINVTMLYVENENGIAIDGHRAAEIRRYARLIWVHMSNNGELPTSWGKASVKLSQAYCREMRQRFSELALCELDWKADQIATDNYPSWYKNWSESSQKTSVKQEAVKQEAVTLSDTGTAPNDPNDLNQKRPSVQPSEEPAAKKPKVNARPSGLAGMVDTSSFQIKNSLAVVDASKMNSVVINLSSTTIPQDPANMTLIPTVAAATVGMVDTSSFQIKNPLAVVDASKMNSAVINSSSTTIPQDPANMTLMPTVADSVTDVSMDSDASSMNVVSAVSDAVTSTATMTPPVSLAEFVADVSMDASVSFGITPAPSSDTTATSESMNVISAISDAVTTTATMTLPVNSSEMSSNTTVTTAMTIPIDVVAPPGVASVATTGMDFSESVGPMAGANSAASTATMTLPVYSSEMSSNTTVTTATTIPVAVAAPPGVASAATTGMDFSVVPMAGANSVASSLMLASATMPTATVETFSSTMIIPTTMGVPVVSTPNSAASLAMPIPTPTVDSFLPNMAPNGGIETSLNIVTKKKLTTKKRTTNSNTPKNLCARDWVPAVGGTTEEFERHWAGLPEEEKQKYIERSKQLKLAALGR